MLTTSFGGIFDAANHQLSAIWSNNVSELYFIILLWHLFFWENNGIPCAASIMLPSCDQSWPRSLASWLNIWSEHNGQWGTMFFYYYIYWMLSWFHVFLFFILVQTQVTAEYILKQSKVNISLDSNFSIKSSIESSITPGVNVTMNADLSHPN